MGVQGRKYQTEQIAGLDKGREGEGIPEGTDIIQMGRHQNSPQ